MGDVRRTAARPGAPEHLHDGCDRPTGRARHPEVLRITDLVSGLLEAAARTGRWTDHDFRPVRSRSSIPGMSESQGAFTECLGLTFQEISGDKVVATWTAGPEHHQPYGIVHGGVYASIVETLGSMGSAAWYGDQGKVVGVSNNTDFFRAVTSGDMTSTAFPIHQGRSSQVWVVETHDDQKRMVARGQLRVQNLAERS